MRHLRVVCAGARRQGAALATGAWHVHVQRLPAFSKSFRTISRMQARSRRTLPSGAGGRAWW